MTPREQVECGTKCRFVIYDLADGRVVDVGSGGGFGEGLTGEAFLLWRFTDREVAASRGCVPYFFNQWGQGRPKHVDLGQVDLVIETANAWESARRTGDRNAVEAAYSAMCQARDAAFTFWEWQKSKREVV